MHCSACGATVPEGSAFCSTCGASVGSISAAPAAAPPKRKLGCFATAAIIVVILIVIGMLAPDKKAENSSAAANGSTAADVEPAELPLAVTASELLNAYDNNEASAQGYFGKRLLLVSGTVDKVTLDFMDDPEVLLKTPNQFMSAHAALSDKAKGEATNFNPGDKVKLLCEDISEVAGTPMLKECHTAPAGQKSQPVQWAK